MTTHMDGALLIAQERARQQAIEGHDAEHDDVEHGHSELVHAARAYASVYDWPAEMARGRLTAENVGWPWEMEAWKPTDDPIRNLVKAGALIAAQIDQLLRREGHVPDHGGVDVASLLVAAGEAAAGCDSCGLQGEELAALLRTVGLADAVSTEAPEPAPEFAAVAFLGAGPGTSVEEVPAAVDAPALDEPVHENP